MEKYETGKDFVEKLATEVGCAPELVYEVAEKTLELLHKVAFCDNQSATAALMEARFTFGGKACYHLFGIMEESRRAICPDGESWLETMMRFSPDLLKEYEPLLQEWKEKYQDEDRKKFKA